MKKFIIPFLVFLTVAACSTKLMLPGEGQELVQSEQARKGQKVFMEYCNGCHPAGNAGLGPSIINKPLPGFLIKMQVRNGYGVMPSFNEKHISEEELNNIVKYIKKL